MPKTMTHSADLQVASAKVQDTRKAWNLCRSSALEILRHFNQVDAVTREDVLRTTLDMWTAEEELECLLEGQER